MTRYCWRCAAPLGAPPPTSCAHCGEVHYVNPKPCGDAVVIENGRVLLLLRASEPFAGCWDVPGGFCEADEHPMRAAERELREEVGLVGRATDYVGTWMDTYGPPADDGVQVHTACSAYLVALQDSGAPLELQTGEAKEARWFGLGALPEALAFPRHQRPMLVAAAALAQGAGRPLPDRLW